MNVIFGIRTTDNGMYFAQLSKPIQYDFHSLREGIDLVFNFEDLVVSSSFHVHVYTFLEHLLVLAVKLLEATPYLIVIRGLRFGWRKDVIGHVK